MSLFFWILDIIFQKVLIGILISTENYGHIIWITLILNQSKINTNFDELVNS